MTYTQPLLLLFFALLALAIFKSRSRWSKTVLVGSAIGLFLCTWPPFAFLISAPLESGYSREPLKDNDAQAIVVLASTVYPPSPPLLLPTLGYDTAERTIYAGWLYQNWKQLPVLASGGGSASDFPYADIMRDSLIHSGVPESMAWAESKSRSTYESAVLSAALLRSKNIRKIVLVTEAYHMRRSELCFRRQGIEVVPAPCGFRFPESFQPGYLLPGWEAVSWNEDVLHEAVALCWYRIRRWI